MSDVLGKIVPDVTTEERERERESFEAEVLKHACV